LRCINNFFCHRTSLWFIFNICTAAGAKNSGAADLIEFRQLGGAGNEINPFVLSFDLSQRPSTADG